MVSDRTNLGLIILRCYLALTMIIHATARIYLGGVLPFGEFLSSMSFPAGLYLAWAITLFELFGGMILIVGYFVSILSLLFVFQLTLGIVLVHFKEGWFVVGAGRNGMEYSVLLIISFLVIAMTGAKKTTDQGLDRSSS